MSRSQGPQVQSGGPQQQPAGHGSPFDQQAWYAAGRGGQQPAQGGYPGPVEVPAIDPYAQGHHYQQGAPEMAFGRAPQQAPLPSSQQGQYAVPKPQPYQQQYAPYTQQPAPVQPTSQGRAADPQYYQQTQPAYAPQPAADLRGPAYDQWPQPAQDPRAYDLASYQPAAQQPQYAPQSHPGYQPQAPAADWGTHDPFAPQQHGMDPSLDPNGYGALQPQGSMQEQGYADDDLVYEQDEPPKRKSTMMIAAVLAASVVVGGGLMYAYDALLGTNRSDAGTPVVKNSAGPTKVKPADPGGMKFDHADSKVMGRLGEGGDTATGGDSLDASGTRKVSTLKVNPDGTIQPPDVSAAPPETAPAAPASAPIGIPGLSVVDVSGPRPQAVSLPVPAAPAPSIADVGAAAPEKPVIISKPAPPEAPAAAAAPAAPAVAAKKQPAAPPAEKVEKKVAIATPTPSAAPAAPVAAATAPKPTGAGYVAVLASVPATGSSQLDALRQFAELKTKYASLLADKTPEVQSANLGDKGTYHRLLAGPPGSQESVKTLCSNLKAAGYAGCWPLAY